MEVIDSFSRGEFPEGMMYYPDTKGYKDAWAKTIDAAEKYNDPGRFTAFIGYEWTSQVPPGQNLHRVVIYRDDAEKARQTVPATTYAPQGRTDPEYLWELLQAYEDKTGGDVLAIAHNGNLSNGLMFPMINPVDNTPLTQEYAETRANWEPLYEVTQIKGDGETHPFLSPNDEYRRLRYLGQRESQPERGQDGRNVGARVRAQRSPTRLETRREAGHESLQVRNDRLDGQSHSHGDSRR